MDSNYRHQLPVTTFKQMAEDNKFYYANYKEAFAAEYKSYMLDKLVAALKMKRDTAYSASQKEYMKNIINMYVELKYIDTDKTKAAKSKTILDAWFRGFKPELIAVLLEDMINRPNEATEKYIAIPRDEIIEKSEQRYISCSVENGEIKAKHHILCGDAINERDMVYTQMLMATMRKYGFTREQAEGLYKKAMGIQMKYRYPINIMLDLTENLENLMNIAETDEVLQEEIVKEHLKNSVRFGGKNLLMQNPKYLIARLNFFNWINSESREDGIFKDKKPMNNPERFINTLMWERSGLYESYEYEINQAMQNLTFANKEENKVSKPQISYAQIMQAYMNSEEFLYEKTEDGKKVLRDEDSKESLRIGFIDSMLNVEFGEPTDKELQFMRLHYNQALEKGAEKEAIREEAKDTSDLRPLVREVEGKRKKVYISLVSEKEDQNEAHNLPQNNDNFHDEPANANSQAIEAYINDYIDEVERLGIECEIEVESDRITEGKPVRYFVFKVGNYRICETIGQKGNRTYILKSDKPVIEFCEEISKRDSNFAEIAKSGEAVGINHMGKRKEDSLFNPNRILLLAEMIAASDIEGEDVVELRRKILDLINPTDYISLDEVHQDITKEVPLDDVVNATQYISGLLQKQARETERYSDLQKLVSEHLDGQLSEKRRRDRFNQATSKEKSKKYS